MWIEIKVITLFEALRVNNFNWKNSKHKYYPVNLLGNFRPRSFPSLKLELETSGHNLKELIEIETILVNIVKPRLY